MFLRVPYRCFSGILLAVSCLLYSAIPTADTMTNFAGMKFKRIPAGTFQMGNEDTLPSSAWYTNGYLKTGLYNEKPAHQVTLTQDFYMGVCEVTNRQFKNFKPNYGSDIAWYSGADSLPVNQVSWFAADSFCRWLSANDTHGWTYRLPTEAEWEYSCRAGTATPWYTGDTVTTAAGNLCFGWGCNPVLKNVGSFPSNPFGLFDMMGNADEWCLDWYGPYSPDSAVDPAGHIFRSQGHTAICMRVVRGISPGYRTAVRSATRAGWFPDNRKVKMGFRVVISDVVPSAFTSSVDTPQAWQTDVSQAAPAPAAVVSGETYTDLDGRAFNRTRMVQDRSKNLVFTGVWDSVVYVSDSPLADTLVRDRKSAGLFARGLSERAGVLYRISNRYELACAGVRANADEYYLTILPELAYAVGRPHPDVACYIHRNLKGVPAGSEGPLYSDWNVGLVCWGIAGSGLVECPNRDLLMIWYSDIGEDSWLSNSGIARLNYGSDEWGPSACDFDIPGYQNGFSYYYVDKLGRLVGGPTSWADGNNVATCNYLGNRIYSSDNGVHWSCSNNPRSWPESPAWQMTGDTVVWNTWNGNLAVSFDRARTWTQYTNEGDHGIEATACYLDDGTALILARSGGTAPYMYKYLSADYGRTWAKTATPFCLNNDPGNHPYHIKLQSGRILQACYESNGAKSWIFGESVDQGKSWFCRRACETGGYTIMTQTRDGLIHLVGDAGRRPGGAFTQLTFSEQWLREGNCLPESVWGAPNPPAGSVADSGKTEPAYFDSLTTTCGRPSNPGRAGLSLIASPNPFNPSTIITVTLRAGKAANLQVLDVRGCRVRSWPLNSAGNLVRLTWDGTDNSRKPVTSGVYIARLTVDGKTCTRKLLLNR